MNPITVTIELEITPVSSTAFLCGEIVVVTDGVGKPALNSVDYGTSTLPFHGSTIRFESARAFRFVPMDPCYWRLIEKKHGTLWKDGSDNLFVAVESIKESADPSSKNVLELTIQTQDPKPPFNNDCIYQSIYQILGLFPRTPSVVHEENKKPAAPVRQPQPKLPPPPPPGTSGINISDGSILGKSKATPGKTLV
jgi:hypothetical protein